MKTRHDAGAVPALSDADIPVIILAAGRSVRFGETNKLLTQINGAPLITHTLSAAADAGISRMIIVTGHEAEAVEAAVGSWQEGRGGIASHHIRFIYNEVYHDGMGSSVATGVRQIPPGTSSAFLTVGDLRHPKAETYQKLWQAHCGRADRIAVAKNGDQPGHPVLIGQDHFAAFANLNGDTGGREILRSQPDRIIHVTCDESIADDIDTKADIRGAPARS
ncbi:MAG: nucleotidyltransferase family protein [Pseudomonadota bacterium]